jgi:hypothetical protein
MKTALPRLLEVAGGGCPPDPPIEWIKLVGSLSKKMRGGHKTTSYCVFSINYYIYVSFLI